MHAPDTGFTKSKKSLVLSTGLLGLSAFLLITHANTILRVRDVSVPLVAKLPGLERQLNVLKEQVELSELHATTRTGSHEERIHVYVLPEEPDLDRLLATIEVFQESLRRKGQLGATSSIDLREEEKLSDDVSVQRMTAQFAVTDPGIRTILQFVQVAGVLTVGDALQPDELDFILRKTEEENPAGIVALEQFLTTDLFAFSRNPKLYTERVFRSFSSDSFHEALLTILQSSLLRDSQELFGGEFGQAIERAHLWPVQLIRLGGAELKQGGSEGWYRLTLDLLVYSRS